MRKGNTANGYGVLSNESGNINGGNVGSHYGAFDNSLMHASVSTTDR